VDRSVHGVLCVEIPVVGEKGAIASISPGRGFDICPGRGFGICSSTPSNIVITSGTLLASCFVITFWEIESQNARKSTECE